MKCEHEWRHYHLQELTNDDGDFNKVYFYCKKCLNNKIMLVKL